MESRLLYIVMLLFLPTIVSAQGTGGQVSRPVKTTKSEVKRAPIKKRESKKVSVSAPPSVKEGKESVGYDVEFICSIPESNIEIDGTYYFKASGTIFLKTGEHYIIIKAEGYEDYQETIYVDSNSRKFVISMTPIKEAEGYDVSFECNVPNAKLYIDDALYESIKGPYFLKTGLHSIKFEADGYESITKNVEVNSKSKKFTFNMKERESNQSSSFVKAKQTITVDNVSFNMIYVEGGTFIMGATSEQGSDAYKNEMPAHQVILSSYYIGETEVTQELWETVMGKNPSKFKGSRNRPVDNISWKDCLSFIEKMNTKSGLHFRMPTEAEWEFAARGGIKSLHYKYSGSNIVEDVAWYDKNSKRKTHDVKNKKANELGLYDMSGNVYEWVQDCKGNYSSAAQTDPTGPSLKSSSRIDRGGSWRDNARDCRVSSRDNSVEKFSFENIGLRLVLQLLPH